MRGGEGGERERERERETDRERQRERDSVLVIERGNHKVSYHVYKWVDRKKAMCTSEKV